MSAAIQAWSETGEATGKDAIRERYLERWSWYSGTAFQDLARRAPMLRDDRVYSSTSLLFKHTEAMVNFYAAMVYQGDLSTDGKPLPDGTLGAIPIDPQTGDRVQDKLIRIAISQAWADWNWKENKSLRPMYAAALADCLTELVDDVDRGEVYSSIVPPWRVIDMDLDSKSNIKAYVTEEPITEDAGNGQLKTYVFRKEVDGEAYRYYRDDKPFDAYPGGAVQPNPYGFVPAIWDRHRKGEPGAVRGVAATDGTRQALMQINSLLSHSFDFQQKAFRAPLIVRGKITKPGQTTIEAAADAGTARSGVVGRLLDRVEQRARRAETLDILETDNPNAAILQAQFDIGKTLEIIEFLKKGILAENPEGTFWQALREMSQATRPGVDALMGDTKGNVKRVSDAHDTQTIKLFQMHLAISGMRANGGGWTVDANGRTRKLTRRQQAYLPFNLDSYHEGKLDFGILSRELITPNAQQIIEQIIRKEAIVTRTGLIEAGYSGEIEDEQTESEVDRMLRERREAMQAEVGDYSSVDDEGQVA